MFHSYIHDFLSILSWATIYLQSSPLFNYQFPTAALSSYIYTPHSYLHAALPLNLSSHPLQTHKGSNIPSHVFLLSFVCPVSLPVSNDQHVGSQITDTDRYHKASEWQEKRKHSFTTKFWFGGKNLCLEEVVCSSMRHFGPIDILWTYKYARLLKSLSSLSSVFEGWSWLYQIIKLRRCNSNCLRSFIFLSTTDGWHHTFGPSSRELHNVIRSQLAVHFQNVWLQTGTAIILEFKGIRQRPLTWKDRFNTVSCLTHWRKLGKSIMLQW